MWHCRLCYSISSCAEMCACELMGQHSQASRFLGCVLSGERLCWQADPGDSTTL